MGDFISTDTARDCTTSDLKVDQCQAVIMNAQIKKSVTVDALEEDSTEVDLFIDVVFEALGVADQYMLEDFKQALLCYISNSVDSLVGPFTVCDIFTHCLRHEAARSLACRSAALIVTNRTGLGVERFQRLLQRRGETQSQFISVIEELLVAALK